MTTTSIADPAARARPPGLVAETGVLARLAAPIVVAQLAYMATGATDSIMAGRLGTGALAAVGLGAAIWVPVTTFIGGALYVLLPLIAGHAAAGRDGAGGRDAVQAAWGGIAIGLIGALFLAFGMPQLLPHMGVDPALIDPTAAYLAAVAPGVPLVGLSMAARYFCDGHSDTRPAMVTAIFIALLNVPLNLVLMFDDAFGPGTGAGLGVVGAGISSAICMATGALILTMRALTAGRYAPARRGPVPLRPDLRAMLGLLRQGLPIGLAFLVEYSMMSTVAVLIGGIGAVALAAHQIAFNVTVVLFMIPVSVSIGVSIRVGGAIGAADPAAARRALAAGLALGCGLAMVTAVLVVLFAPEIAGIYAADDAVVALAVRLLLLAAAFQVIDALQVVLGGALRGRGDVNLPLLMMLGAYWLVGMPVGWQMGATEGAAGWWYGILAGITTIAGLFAWRTWRGFTDRALRPLMAAGGDMRS
ncbi:MATE family efflux transporter [Tistrella mobilis]|uniref:MATE family efflux transporter n=1 Tax=Tistrella mobilis TaxID=171437 RepID=UPI00355627FA